MATLGAGAPAAGAAPVGFELDRGVINLGGPTGTWAKIVDPDLTPPDNPATIMSEVAGDGALTAAASDFVFPPKRIEGLETGNVALPVVDANIVISAENALSGNFDTATGAATVVIPADVVITVYSAGSTESVATCRINGFNLNLATSGTLEDPGDPGGTPPRPATTYNGSPFAPPAVEGELLGSWASLPTSQVVSGGLAPIVCPALDGMLGGPGAIWFSGKAGPDIKPGIPLPSKAPKITGTPANSTESTTADFKFEKPDDESSPVTGFECKLDAGAFEACDAGTKSYSGLAVGDHSFEVRSVNAAGSGPVATFAWKVTSSVKPPKGKAKLGALSVKPKKKTIKRGKKATFRVKVKNVGKAAAKGAKVCVTAPKKLVKVKKCVSLGRIAAGAAKSAKFKVKVPKKARKGKTAKLKFRATASRIGARTKAVKIKIG